MKNGSHVALSVALVLAAVCLRAFADDSPVVLHTGDVPMGVLGRPLGELVLLEGMRAQETKIGVNTLAVDTIDDKKLAAPISIWVEQVNLPRDGRYALRGYETIKMIGEPPAYAQLARLKGEPALSGPQAGWQVFDFFVALEAVQPRTLKVETPEPEDVYGEPDKSVKPESYEAALIDAVCRIAAERSSFDEPVVHMKAILDQHPKLVNARHIFQLPHKPSFEDDFTPLHFAVGRGNEEMAALLLERGAEVDSLAGGGFTPLHLAAEAGNLPVVKLLVINGADVNARTKAVPQMSSDELPGQPGTMPGEKREPPTIFPAVPPKSALDLARDGKHADVVEYLQSINK